MSDATASNDRVRAWVSGWITAMLSIAAAVAIGLGIWLGLGEGDTEVYESPLLLSVARQLIRGPWGLYGPFGGQNPLVLIHAPLYYHLAAFLARPLYQAGVEPMTAARLAGRALSFTGLLITAWCAFRIARLDGAPARAGWWAACLIMTAPVMDAMPYTVRPDLAGIALQTAGVFLILRALYSERPGGLSIVCGFAAFGLAMCVKQHLVGGFITGTILLLWAARRGRVAPRLIGLGVFEAAAIVAAVYGVEELATEGRMSQALFVAAPAATRVHPANWTRALIVLSNVAGGTLGLIALQACAGLALVASRSRSGMTAAVVGTALVAVALFLAIVHYFRASAIDVLISTMAVSLCLFLVIPCCMILERRVLLRDRVDVALCLFGFTELLIIVPLFRASTGSWVNYAIQGVVFAAILTAKSLSRACDFAARPRLIIPMAIAASALLLFELSDAYLSLAHRRAERRSVERLLGYVQQPRSVLYFAGAPGRNRVYGRRELVFDDWLYPVFESVHAAEPRSSWLRRVLSDGSVRFVITNSDDPRIDGVDEPLTSLGYVGRLEADSLYVWERIRTPGP
jgi:hypothetical protein